MVDWWVDGEGDKRRRGEEREVKPRRQGKELGFGI